MRVGYEFDGPWNGYQPAQYIAAYRRIVDIFRARGVTNAAFIWNASTSSNMSNLMSWYPGDTYVGWFSYNCWNICTPDSDYVTQAGNHDKPIVIGESSKHYLGAWDDFAPPYFASLRSSGVGSFQ